MSRGRELRRGAVPIVRSLGALAALAASSVVGCGGEENRRGGTPPSAAAHRTGTAEAEPSWFTDVTAERGLAFVHRPALDGSYFMPEIVGPGGALFDADGDGDLDLYLVQGPAGSGDRFFRQEPDGTFTDVTEAVGLAVAGGHGMGCAVGDVDNDGDLDLYVTRYGRDLFFRNSGGGRFEEAAGEAGLGVDDGWSTSAGFFDADGDGDLDLYVVRYLLYDPERVCRGIAGNREYCGPRSFLGLSDLLYRNRGDGTFEDASAAAGLDRVAGKGLGLFPADFDGDGRIDVYVANDGEDNQLWLNLGGGRFEDRALVMGAALNIHGLAEASMGVASGDSDGDGDLDLFLTHLIGETNTLYRYLDGVAFEDRTNASGLGGPSLRYTGFGTVFFDLEHDGDLDLAVVDGKVRLGGEEAAVIEGGAPPAAPAAHDLDGYAETNLVFENDGAGSYRDVSSRVGELASRAEVSRGLLSGDLDGDGDLDLVVTNAAGPARLYRNDRPGKGHWLRVRAIDPALGRDAVGALVRVEAGGRVQVRPVTHTYGYLTTGEAVTHFGLGAAAAFERVVVRWPDGSEEAFAGGPGDREVTVRRGEGEAP